MDKDIAREVDFRRAAQGFAKDVFLDLELVLVAGVLVVASSALAEVRTFGLNAVRGRFEDTVSMGASKAGFLLGDGGFDFFRGKNEGNECCFPGSALVGR